MANKLALVTGASSGIGLSLATDLARRGYDLVVCSAGDRLKTRAQQLQFSQVEVVPVQADLANSEGIERLWEQVVALERNLDIACINAGVGVGELFVETGLDAELRSWPVMTTCMQPR
jgi:uncharacterized protein